MNIQDKLYQILQFNDNLAFSILELVDRILDRMWVVRYFKVLCALARLEHLGISPQDYVIETLRHEVALRQLAREKEEGSHGNPA